MAGVIIMIMIATLTVVMRPFFPALFPLLPAKVPGPFHDLRWCIAEVALLPLLPVQVPFRLAGWRRLGRAGRFKMFFRAQRLFQGMMLYVRL
jgi:hypothetical protein